MMAHLDAALTCQEVHSKALDAGGPRRVNAGSMFRGPATLMQRNPQMKWVFGGGVAACLLLVLAGMLLPGTTKLIAFAVITVAMLAVYPRLLSGALKPEPVSVALYVDQSGVYGDDAPLPLREDIAQAYIQAGPRRTGVAQHELRGFRTNQLCHESAVVAFDGRTHGPQRRPAQHRSRWSRGRRRHPDRPGLPRHSVRTGLQGPKRVAGNGSSPC